MFADDWGGGSVEPTPAPAASGDGLTPELLDSCRESTRRAERLVERLAPLGREMDRFDRVQDLGWAIRAIEGEPVGESEQ